jgi:hypothetical protein
VNIPIHIIKLLDPAAAVVLNGVDILLGLFPGQVQFIHNPGDAMFHVANHPYFENVIDPRKQKMAGSAMIDDIMVESFLAQDRRHQSLVMLQLQRQPFGINVGFDDGGFKLADGDFLPGRFLQQILPADTFITQLVRQISGEFLAQTLTASGHTDDLHRPLPRS